MLLKYCNGKARGWMNHSSNVEVAQNNLQLWKPLLLGCCWCFILFYFISRFSFQWIFLSLLDLCESLVGRKEDRHTVNGRGWESKPGQLTWSLYMRHLPCRAIYVRLFIKMCKEALNLLLLLLFSYCSSIISHRKTDHHLIWGQLM